MDDDLARKKQIYDIFDTLEDSDDAPDEGRIASETVLKRKHTSKTPTPPPKLDSRPSAPSISDTSLSARSPPRKPAVDAVPPSTDPPHVARHRTALPSGLEKSVSDVATKSSIPASVAGKRKRETSFKCVPEDQQIFRHLVFFFFPNDDKNPARRLRIAKAREYGAVWQREFNDEVTHVIADKSMDCSALLKWLRRTELAPHVEVTSEIWPADCIAYRALLDPAHVKFAVKGYRRQPDAKITAPKETAVATKSSEPDRSLHLKLAGKGVTVREAETPPKEVLQAMPTAVIDFAQEREIERVPAAFADTAIDSSKELDEAIAKVRQLQHIPLDDEDPSSSLTSADALASGDEEQPTGLKLLEKRGLKRKRLREQEKWQCMQKHDGNKSGSPNETTIDVLQQMADYYGRTGDEWRTRAYRKAIATLRNHPTKVRTKEEAGALPNVGPRLAEKIEEIVYTNKLRRLVNAQAEPQDQVLQTFMGVYGAGIKTATLWVEQGYQTLDELRAKADLTENQRIGIDHYEDFQSRIPRAEVAQHGEMVRRALREIDPAFDLILAGSYRRGSQDSRDVDCIVTRADTGIHHLRNVLLGQLVPRLTAEGFLVARLAATTTTGDGSKWHGASCLPGSTTWRRLDILLVPGDELGAALIYFTGNDIFNRSLRLLAGRKGMRLNQRGLYQDVMRATGRVKLTAGSLVEGKDEKKIFEALNVPWRPPEHRIC